MKQVIIFGGGISGLTVAHELVKKGFKVTVVEKDTCLGGMAKTRWENNNTPSEHSWRGWSNTYSNTFRLMKEIPYNGVFYKENNTVYDNLTESVKFYEFNDKFNIHNSKSTPYSVNDVIVILNDSAKYLLSDKRKEYYYTVNAAQHYKNKLSNRGYDFFINCVQTAGFGMENKDGSLGHFLKLLTLPYTNPLEYRKNNKDNKIDMWRLFNQPTNDGWFIPWQKYLENQGIVFILNTELCKINVRNNEIISVYIKSNIDNVIYEIDADEYVFAINPFNLEEILRNSIPDDILYKQFNSINEKTDSRQISFRIGINKNIKYKQNDIGLVLSDENGYNMTFYPQNKHWSEFNNMKIPYKTLWSGTLMNTQNNGIVYNKPSITLTKEQLKNEIKQQIVSSRSFQNMIFEHNNFNISFDDIEYIEIWYEWNTNPETNLLEQNYKKWVNTTYNEYSRPLQQTNFKNLILAGAHTKTTMVIYSMEGAVESGLLASNVILKKYKYPKISIFSHKESVLLEPFKKVDNILYENNFPNILTLIEMLLLFMIVYYFIYYLVLV